MQALHTHHTILYKETECPQTWLSMGTLEPIFFYRNQGETLLYSWFHGGKKNTLKESPKVKALLARPPPKGAAGMEESARVESREQVLQTPAWQACDSTHV